MFLDVCLEKSWVFKRKNVNFGKKRFRLLSEVLEIRGEIEGNRNWI